MLNIVEQSWAKLYKVEQSWENNKRNWGNLRKSRENLSKVEQSWTKLNKVEQSWLNKVGERWT